MSEISEKRSMRFAGNRNLISKVRLAMDGELFESRFNILEILSAENAKNSVFRAHDRELGSEVIVKILRLDQSPENEAIEKFAREAKALCSLEHPNFAKVYEISLNRQSDMAYIVSECFEAKTLADELALNGPLSSKVFFEVFFQLSKALSYLHEKKLAHRDLKPANVLICGVGSDGDKIIKIVDFGLGRFLQKELKEGKAAKSEKVLGSPPYLSPEQCRAEKGDAAADIYSLACMMHECLLGTPPFLGESDHELIYKHLSQKASKLAENAQTEAGKELACFIDLALEKKAELRPAASDLLLLLNNIRGKELGSFSGHLSKGLKNWALILIILFLNLVLLYLLFSFEQTDSQKLDSKRSNQKKTEIIRQ